MSSILAILTKTCHRTLVQLSLEGQIVVAPQDFESCLKQCLALEELDLTDECHEPQCVPLLAQMLQSLAHHPKLRSITGHLNTSIAKLLADFYIPSLTYLHLQCWTQHGFHPLQVVQEPLLRQAMFKIYGSQICTLEITTFVFVGNDDELFCALLDHQPNLETLVCDLIHTRYRALNRPHVSLQRVVANSFCPRTTVNALDHTDQVFTLMHSFCGPDFPALKAIRCIDLQPNTFFSVFSKVRMHFPRPCLTMASMVAEMCARRNVRLEDSLERLVMSDLRCYLRELRK